MQLQLAFFEIAFGFIEATHCPATHEFQSLCSRDLSSDTRDGTTFSALTNYYECTLLLAHLHALP